MVLIINICDNGNNRCRCPLVVVACECITTYGKRSAGDANGGKYERETCTKSVDVLSN